MVRGLDWKINIFSYFESFADCFPQILEPGVFS